MTKILYKPFTAAAASSSKVMQYYWRSTVATRNSMAFAIIVCLVIVYVIWAASGSDQSVIGASLCSGNLENVGNKYNHGYRRQIMPHALQAAALATNFAASSTSSHSLRTSFDLIRKSE